MTHYKTLKFRPYDVPPSIHFILYRKIFNSIEMRLLLKTTLESLLSTCGKNIFEFYEDGK